MEFLSLIWACGEGLSVVALIFGALLTTSQTEPFPSLFRSPAERLPPAAPHQPTNHRLILEREW